MAQTLRPELLEVDTSGCRLAALAWVKPTIRQLHDQKPALIGDEFGGFNV
jgi:hypothetical protein